MKLYKDDILKILDKYGFFKEEYIILSGASLVLQNIKEYTTDIDIAVSNDLYNELLKKYNCSFEKEINNYKVWFIDNVINFSQHYYEETEYTKIFDYKVQTIDSILELKKNLNRSKDEEDIKAILNFCKTKNNI